MEFLLMILFAGLIGGLLGFLSAKKSKPAKSRKIEGVILAVALGLTVYGALTVSKAYYICAVLVAGELIGRMIPNQKT